MICSGVLMCQAQEEWSFEYGGLERSFYLDLPPGDPIGKPLVFVLHSYTSSAWTIRAYSGWTAIADEGGAVVCYPQGTNDFIGVPHWNSNLGISDTDDVGFLVALAEHLQDTYALNKSCMYSCGMSNGGFMSYTLACERPDIFRAVGSVAGSMSAIDQEGCDPSEVVPIIHLHGTNDPVVSYNQGVIGSNSWSGGWGIPDLMDHWSGLMETDQVEETAMPNVVLLDLTTVDFIRHFDAPGGQEFHHYRVNGGMHDWCGVWGNQDIDATTLMWEFFENACAGGFTEVETLRPNAKKELVRVIDMLGREAPILPGALRIYLYSDGSSEKRILEVD